MGTTILILWKILCFQVVFCDDSEYFELLGFFVVVKYFPFKKVKSEKF